MLWQTVRAQAGNAKHLTDFSANAFPFDINLVNVKYIKQRTWIKLQID